MAGPDRTIPPGIRCDAHEAVFKETWERLTRVEGKVDTLDGKMVQLDATMRSGVSAIREQLRDMAAKDVSQNGHMTALERQVAEQAGATKWKRWAAPLLTTVLVGAASILATILLKILL